LKDSPACRSASSDWAAWAATWRAAERGGVEVIGFDADAKAMAAFASGRAESAPSLGLAPAGSAPSSG
jgi:hypothetical protein